MALPDDVLRHIERFIDDPAALRVIGWGLCQPNISPFTAQAKFELRTGETPLEAADRLDLSWSPAWLTDAGFELLDAGGVAIRVDAPATTPGEVAWSPQLRAARLDDQIPNRERSGSARFLRRLTGELAVAALWEADRAATNAPDLRPAVDLDGNARGATFRDFLLAVLRLSLPDDWKVRHEVPLIAIRGLHMRRNVGGRSSDIVVTDGGNRLVAVISSKWTWRSDRGTEAAQMVPLRMYRPDVPYSLVTAEFARVKVIARESIEDSVFHLAPPWAGAWLAATRGPSARVAFPSLEELQAEGRASADAMGLGGLDGLVEALRAIGTIL